MSVQTFLRRKRRLNSLVMVDYYWFTYLEFIIISVFVILVRDDMVYLRVYVSGLGRGTGWRLLFTCARNCNTLPWGGSEY